METMTIRDLYIQRVRENEQKIAQKEIKTIREEEALLRQEEARMRQEEARMRQEAEKKITAAIINCHNQGLSAERIADLLLQPLAFVQDVIKNK